MGAGAWTLGEFPLPLVRLSCAKCGRRGQYWTAKLLERHGPDTAMPELRHVLAQCPRREQWHDPCMVVFVDKLS